MTPFYIVSKIFIFFLAPVHWIYILLLIAFFSKRVGLKRKLRIAAFLIFILFSNEAFYNLVVNSWQPGRITLKDSAGYSAGIVLGGMVKTDKKHHGYFNESSDRFIQTLLLYKQGAIKKIVVSGGSTFNEIPKEADFVRAQFIKAGVPAEDVFVENQSKNTFENAALTKAIIDQQQLRPPYVLVTSAFHITRSVKVFENAGMHVIGYPSTFLVVNESLDFTDYFVPKLKVLDNWKYVIKEVLGIVAYKLTGKA
jgi:uncharacterized SAM-binding protein YcdF (DUF218 family)